jgi:parvulin-like peptidyl-prolyl isomerase
MPITVNGEPVPDALVEEERSRLQGAPELKQIREPAEAGRWLNNAALSGAIDRVLLKQEMAKDPTPVSPEDVAQELQRLIAQGRCRTGVDESAVREAIENQLRFQRTVRALTGGPGKPSPGEIKAAYAMHRPRLQRPEAVHAVKHVNANQTESEARAQIEVALAELEQGGEFGEVAARHSDCKGGGCDLGTFPRGVMVEDFDRVVFALQPGERSGIFRTPFGFHIALLREKIPARIPEFEEAAPEIEAFLSSMGEQMALRKALDRLRGEAVIQHTESSAGAA